MLFLTVLPSISAVEITEIMYNPTSMQGGNYYSEWIELYNNESGSINVSGWKICNNNLLSGYVNFSDKNIYFNNNLIIPNNSYVIITDGGSGTKAYDYFNISNSSIALHTDASSICGGLNNSGETVSLYDSNSMLIYQVNYTDLAKTGHSIELVNESWQASLILGGSPGEANSIAQQTNISHDLSIENNLDQKLYTDFTLTSLFKITNLYSQNGVMHNVTVNYNITKNNVLIKSDTFTKDQIILYTSASTGSFTPTEAGTYTIYGSIVSSTPQDENLDNNQVCTTVTVIDGKTISCDVGIYFDIDKILYNEGEKIGIKYVLTNTSFPFIVQYWIEDLKGQIHKNPVNSSNTNKKTWTTSIEEEDQAFFVKAKLIYIGCNDINSTNNQAQFLFVVNSSEETAQSSTSSIIIERVYQGSDNKSKFGEHVRVKVIVYKGDTTKTSIQAYIKDDSDVRVSSVISRANVENKFTTYEFTLPIQTKPNCNELYPNGTYTLVVTGLDQTATIPVVLEGITDSLCEEKLVEASTTSKKSSLYTITSIPSKIYPDKSFTTKVQIKNTDDEDHDYFVWSYLYRGSKCYSGLREQNLQEITVNAESKRTVTLKNTVDKGAEEGQYKFKVKIKRDDRKTTKELTRDLEVSAQQEQNWIQSFYTRAKNYNEEIKLFSKIDTGTTKKVTLKLYSLFEEQEKNVSIKGSETIEFKVKIFPGKNTFFLIVKDGDEVKDIKELTLWVNETSISTAKQDVTSYIPGITTPQSLTTTVQKISERPYVIKKERVLYESPAVKARKLVTPLIIILLALITLGSVIKSKPQNI